MKAFRSHLALAATFMLGGVVGGGIGAGAASQDDAATTVVTRIAEARTVTQPAAVRTVTVRETKTVVKTVDSPGTEQQVSKPPEQSTAPSAFGQPAKPRRPQGTRVVPRLGGLTVAVAEQRLRRLQLSPRVEDGGSFGAPPARRA